MSGDLKFNRRYALVDEAAYERLSAKRPVPSTDPLLKMGSMSSIKKTAQSLRQNMADPFKDETQKAIAHTQLLRSYLQDLDSLQRNTPRGQESNQAVARSPTVDNQQQRDKTVAETPDQPVKLQTPTKPQKKRKRHRRPTTTQHTTTPRFESFQPEFSPSTTRMGKTYGPVKNRRGHAWASDEWHTPPTPRWQTLPNRRH